MRHSKSNQFLDGAWEPSEPTSSSNPGQPEIPFNKPFISNRERAYVLQALDDRYLQGNGRFTRSCEDELQRITGCQAALMVQSCTGALEMAAILSGVGPGDEVIMPSYTFVSTANAFVLRGAVPVFVDIRADTLNMDERLITQAITPRTRAVVPVHYAGVSCAMDEIMRVAAESSLVVVEDAAQGLMSKWNGQALGSLGDMGCLSFHATKNLTSGEGGALLLRDPALVERAHVIREKGTNRTQFLSGEASRYTWCDIGSSYLPADYVCALLFAQLERAEHITRLRLDRWHRYHAALEHLEEQGWIRRPIVPPDTEHNGHIYYVIMRSSQARDNARATLIKQGIECPFHYVPLHSSPAGRRFGRHSGPMDVTESISSRILRLPLYPDLTDDAQDAVISGLGDASREACANSKSMV